MRVNADAFIPKYQGKFRAINERHPIRISFIFRQSVTVLISSAAAACRRLPLYRSSARWMSSRSWARKLSVLPAIDASFRCEISGGSSRMVIPARGARITARSMACSSSRTFPGH